MKNKLVPIEERALAALGELARGEDRKAYYGTEGEFWIDRKFIMSKQRVTRQNAKLALEYLVDIGAAKVRQHPQYERQHLQYSLTDVGNEIIAKNPQAIVDAIQACDQYESRKSNGE